MAKQLKFSDEARQSLLKGIDVVAKAVVTTLGPKGRNIALDKKWGAPNIVHDGVTVAKEIELEDPFENMGAQIVKEAADKTNDVAGDGTTTATLLAKEMTATGMKNITAGANPMVVKKGIEKAVEKVVEELEKIAKPIKSQEEITQVATISAGDEEIGSKIAEALNEVGRDGVVSVEEGKGLTIDIEYKEGMEFDKGYVSPYFVSNPDRMESEVDDAYILLTDKKISSVQDMLPFLEKFVKVSKNLVIIADEVIRSGGTIVKSIKALLTMDVGRIFVAATHLTLINNADEKIIDAGAEELISTDSLPSDYSTIKIAPLIKEALKK